MQKRWDTQVGSNKLHELKPTIGHTYLGCQSRHDEVVLRRCRIGHSRFTHEYLLKTDEDEPPKCIPCDERFTVKHILLDCVDFAIARDSHYQSVNLKDLFSRVSGHLIINYLKEIGLYNKF